MAGRWLGLDLGGTNIKSAVLASDDESAAIEVVGREQCPAGADDGPAAVIANLAAAGGHAVERWGRIDGVAVAVPGLFDRSGAIELFPNLPGDWKGTPMTAPIEKALGVPTSIINDARAFTLAESRLGAAAGCDTVAALVLGTGIGGGIVVGGRLHFGRMGRAGELAHQVIAPGGPPCGCGNRGCLEAVAASGAITRLAGTTTVHEAFAAAAQGDGRAAAAIAEVTDYLGIAIANIVTILVPERIVIGGGVAEAGEALLSLVREATARHCTLVDPDWYDIVLAELGPHAGAIGAALWAMPRCAGAADEPHRQQL